MFKAWFIFFGVVVFLAAGKQVLACGVAASTTKYIGHYSDGSSAADALEKATEDFSRCECGGTDWLAGRKYYRQVNNCRFEEDDGDPSKYINIKLSMSYDGQCPGYENPETGKCEDIVDPTQNGGGESDGMCGGNPIDFSNGVKVQHEIDYQHAYSSVLRFDRAYSSATGGWIFPYNQKISVVLSPNPTIVQKPDGSGGYEDYQIDADVDEYISLSRPNGSVYMYTRFSGRSDTYINPKAATGKLVKTSGGWEYHDGKTTEIYDSSGNLVFIRKPAGILFISRNDKTNVTTYKDSYGNILTRTPISGDDFKIADGSGFEVAYAFTAGMLDTVTYSDGSESSSVGYQYNGDLLTSMVDETGFKYASWSYSNGKANMSQHHGGAERIDLVYNGNTVTETNARQKETIYHFETVSGRNRIMRVEGEPSTNCLATDSYYTYDANGFRLTFTDKNGNVTETLRNGRGLVETERSGLVWSNGVDSTLQNTDASQKIVTVWHNDLALPLQRTYYGYDGNSSTYVAYRKEETTYTANNRIDTYTVTDLKTAGHPQRVWDYTYAYHDAEQTRLQSKQVDGPLSTADGLAANDDDSTYYHYDTTGNLTSTVNALGHTTSYSNYNSRGQAGTVTDANNQATTLTYTMRGWLSSVTRGGLTTQYEYFKNGLLKKVSQPDGSWLAYEYNDARHLTAIANNTGERVEYTPLLLNGQWEYEAVKDSTGVIQRQRQRVYDELGRVMTILGQNGQSWSYGYDANDNRNTENDALNRITTHGYDEQNRLAQTTDADQNTITFDYDGQSNITAVQDQRGNTTTYDYNGFGELIKIDSPDTGITTYSYRPDGQRLTQTDARTVTTHYGYDVLGRLETITYNSDTTPSITYSYDDTSNGNPGIGRLTGIVDTNGTLSYRYAAYGLDSFTYDDEARVYTTGYGYNSTGQLQTLTYPSGNAVTYAYDTLGRIHSVSLQQADSSTSETLVSSITYHPFAGMHQVTYGNGVVVNMAIDSDGRTDAISAAGSQTLYDKEYSYDSVNRITGIADFVDSQQHLNLERYDNLSRLEKAVRGTTSLKTWEFDYDAVGNRISRKEYDANAILTRDDTLNYQATSNRLASIDDNLASSNYPVTHDSAGNITSQTRNLVEQQSYQYGDHNRMTVSNSAGSPVASYTYNALGQRIVKVPLDSSNPFMDGTYFHYGQSGQLLAEHNLHTGQSIADYIYVNGQLIARIDNRDQLDVDEDGVPDINDALPYISLHAGLPAGEYRLDSDQDGLPDTCDSACQANGLESDPDADNDAIANDQDNCPLVINFEQDDLDNDDIGDACDDSDGDAVMDAADNCPFIVNADQKNLDADGAGDACDDDIDGDGMTNAEEIGLGRNPQQNEAAWLIPAVYYPVLH